MNESNVPLWTAILLEANNDDDDDTFGQFGEEEVTGRSAQSPSAAEQNRESMTPARHPAALFPKHHCSFAKCQCQ
jgi:hypothetical protein